MLHVSEALTSSISLWLRLSCANMWLWLVEFDELFLSGSFCLQLYFWRQRFLSLILIDAVCSSQGLFKRALPPQLTESCLCIGKRGVYLPFFSHINDGFFSSFDFCSFFSCQCIFLWKIMVKLCKNTILLSSCMLSLTLACWMESKNPKDNTDYILKTQTEEFFSFLFSVDSFLQYSRSLWFRVYKYYYFALM